MYSSKWGGGLREILGIMLECPSLIFGNYLSALLNIFNTLNHRICLLLQSRRKYCKIGVTGGDNAVETEVVAVKPITGQVLQLDLCLIQSRHVQNFDQLLPQPVSDNEILICNMNKRDPIIST